jgi:uncharacterized protein with von Willebrand factor type A (vWA) domain
MYVLDISLSMETRIEPAVRQLKKALAGLQKDESFGIVVFAGEYYLFRSQLKAVTRSNIEAANEFLDKIELKEGTNLEHVLKRVFRVSGIAEVIVITDGIPSLGETNFDKLAGKVKKMNKANARIDTIGLAGKVPKGNETREEIFGAGRLLKDIAQQNGGIYLEETIGEINAPAPEAPPKN